jgi:phosphoserine phosphatase
VIAETEAVIRAELRARLREEVWASCDDVRVAVPRGIRVFGAVARLQERLRSAGFEVWVVSASPRLAVVPFARRIGVEDERVLGMREVVRDGVLSSDLEGPPTYGEGKVMALMRAAGRGPLMAVGDAVTDAEMLGAACAAGGLAVLLDRGDPALRALARERGWLVQPRWIASAV